MATSNETDELLVHKVEIGSNLDTGDESDHSNIPKMTYNYEATDLIIYKAALGDTWKPVNRIFIEHPKLMVKPITARLETPLMVAVGTNCSHNFVEDLVKRIVSYDLLHHLAATNFEGNTALHYAAKVGNLIDAYHLVSQSPRLSLIENSCGDTPLILAASLGRKELVQFLLNMATLYSNLGGGNLITLTVQAGFLDVALQIIDRFPKVVQDENWHAQRALEVLATKPDFFPSGCKLGFFRHLIFSLIYVNKSEVIPEKWSEKAPTDFFRRENKSYTKTARLLRFLPRLASPIKNIRDIKAKHIQSNVLVNRMCKIVIEQADHDIAWKILGSAIATAIRYGTYELIEECILANPSILWYNFEGFNLFHLAIKERQVQVYNLVYQMTGHKAFLASQLYDDEKDNALHIAAKLAPPHRLNIMTGAALQMQRELQWFKEVEKFVEPSYKEALNKNGKTPRMVFTDEHKDLLQEGQNWMKDTASSCTVVAALVVTMAFAAAFTVPGGNQDDGRPLFLDKRTFMLFIVSDAIALFSSSTSVLMFLGILTSRYAEDDFLYALPKRMTIGLVSLFLSIAATMIAFGATLILLLEEKVPWIVVLVVIITFIPVGLFGLLQFRLLVELVYSTYGPSIFRKQNHRMIH